MMYDGNDDDIMFSCLDIRDSMDTMTCVEADLGEDDDVILLSDVDDNAPKSVDSTIKNEPVTIKTEFMANNYDYLTSGLYTSFSDDQSSGKPDDVPTKPKVVTTAPNVVASSLGDKKDERKRTLKVTGKTEIDKSTSTAASSSEVQDKSRFGPLV